MSRLGSCTYIKTGKLDANASSETGKYPFFTCSRCPLKIDSFSYDCECVLVAGNGDLNVKYYFGKFDAYQRTYIIESRDSSVLYVPYLYLFLDSYLETLRVQSIGGVIKYIKLGNLTEAEIPLPPLDEQKKIVAELDKISDLIAKRKNQLKKLDLLVKAKFVEMFGDPVTNPMGWERVSLKQSSQRLSDGPFGSNLKSKHYTESGIRTIRLQNIGAGNFINKDKAFISLKHYEVLKKYTCKSGDIVIATLGDPNLRACILPDNIPISINKADCVHYIPKSKVVNTQFVCQYINIPATMNFASDKIHGQTRSRISSGQVAKIPIYLPPLPLQTQFADFVQAVERTKATTQTGLIKLETLYKARMQEYFG